MLGKLGKLSFLVVDDDATMRNSIARVIGGNFDGAEVETAENGLVALRALKGRPFNLVLLDWMMPVMNGFNFLKTVRQNARLYKTKIIMSTSKKDVQSVGDSLYTGVTSYIIKPFETETLVAKVNLVLGLAYFSPKEFEFLEEAKKHLDKNEFDSALEWYSKALSVVPGNAETKLEMVKTLEQKMEYDKAYKVLSGMLKEDLPSDILRPSSSKMVYFGDMDLTNGKLAESETKYHEAVTADPKQAEGHVGLGEVALKRGDSALAQAHFARAEQLAIDVGEDDIKLMNNIAIRHRKSGRPREAVRVLEKSLQSAQGNPYLLYNLGRAHMELEEMGVAARCFKDALKLAPDMKEAKAMLSTIMGKD
ncbi:MAG: response regulator [Nitrospinae bacterium]|nr:response regulator [Nitrospinota bacterium]